MWNCQDDDETLSSTASSFASVESKAAPAGSALVCASAPKAEQPVKAPESLAEQVMPASSSVVGPGLNTVAETSETGGVKLDCLKDESVVHGQEPGGAEVMRNIATPMKNCNSHACIFLSHAYTYMLPSNMMKHIRQSHTWDCSSRPDIFFLSVGPFMFFLTSCFGQDLRMNFFC